MKTIYYYYCLVNMDIILMGESNAGRSSIAKIIFQKMGSKATMMLGQTNKMETYEFKIHKIDFKLYDFPNKYDIDDPAPNQQMILKNASALIYVMSSQGNVSSSFEIFAKIYHYLKKKNTNNCQFFIFINKIDINLISNDLRDEFLLKNRKKLIDEGVDFKQISLLFTSIMNYSIYQAFSLVLQKILSCSTYICKLLNKLAEYCKMDKVFIIDLFSKLYIAHNDKIPFETVRYQICCEMIDIHIDIFLLYNSEKKQDKSKEPSKDCTTCVKLNVDDSTEEKRQHFYLQELENYLCLGYLIKQSNCDRPYLIEANIAKFKEGLFQLLNDTIK